MDDSEVFEWFDTGFGKGLKRLATIIFLFLLVIFLVGFIAFMAGIFTTLKLIAWIAMFYPAVSVGAFFGYRSALKNTPTKVGISDTKVKFLYRKRDPTEIFWHEIKEIVLPGFWGSRKIIHKDGSVTHLATPDRIVARIKDRFEEYSNGIVKGLMSQRELRERLVEEG
jgi:hypothetical protein